MLRYFKTDWFHNKNIIITGCSSGIGKELARQFIEKYGCKVLGVARTESKLSALSEELGNRFSYYTMDVGDEQAWKNFASSDTVGEFKPDILINNAGIIHPFIRFIDLEDSEIQRVIRTNYLSLIYSCRTMIPVLDKSTVPTLINISSASALLPVAGASIYSSTKSAAYSLTDVLREELMGSGFYVACVLPGPVKTDLYNSHPGDASGEKVADKKLFASAGISANRAASIIIRKFSHHKNYITVGGIAKGMGWFRNYMPDSSIGITGGMLRVLPIKTFQALFEDEKLVKKSRKIIIKHQKKMDK